MLAVANIEPMYNIFSNNSYFSQFSSAFWVKA